MSEYHKEGTLLHQRQVSLAANFSTVPFVMSYGGSEGNMGGWKYNGGKRSTQLYEPLMGPLVGAMIILLLQWIVDKMK